MKRSIYFLVFFCAICKLLMAQSIKTEFSQTFTDFIGSPALVLKNGYVLFSRDDHKNKVLELLLFDNKHILITRKTIAFSKIDYIRRFASADVTIIPLGYYEINGKIVLFVKDNKVERKMVCGLYRVIINPSTLQIENEELLLTINKGGFSDNSPASSFGADSPFYFLNVDKESGYYAIVKYGYQKKNETESNYDIYWYSPEHKEINKTTFDYLNNKYGYARALNLYVNSDKYIILSTYVFNSESKKNLDTKLVISKIEKGEITHKELEYSNNFSSSYCTIKANKVLKELEMLFYTETGEEGNKTIYELFFQSISPEKMEVKKPYILPQQMLNNYAIQKCGLDKGYTEGFIDGFNFDLKGNIVAVFKKNVIKFSNNGAKTLNPEHVGVTVFEATGKELSAWVYPYNTTEMLAPNIRVVNTAKGNFILLNDLEENIKSPLNKKREYVKKKDLSNAVFITLLENGEIKTDYLFGVPSGRDSNIYGDFANCLYDESTKTLIIVTNQGLEFKNRRVAWVKLE